MKKHQLKVSVGEKAGEVSAEIYEPSTMRCVMTLAHGAGAGMGHSFMVSLAERLAQEGIGTVRFNFPFMEKRSSRPDFPAVAHATISSVITTVEGMYADIPIVVAGKSFGGRMSSQLLCKHTFTGVKGLIFYGFPLHPAGSPGVERAQHLSEVSIPMLFLQGTRDALADKTLMHSVCSTLPTSTLTFIEGADHSFKVGKKDSIGDLSTISSDWLKNVIDI